MTSEPEKKCLNTFCIILDIYFTTSPYKDRMLEIENEYIKISDER